MRGRSWQAWGRNKFQLIREIQWLQTLPQVHDGGCIRQHLVVTSRLEESSQPSVCGPECLAIVLRRAASHDSGVPEGN